MKSRRDSVNQSPEAALLRIGFNLVFIVGLLAGVGAGVRAGYGRLKQWQSGREAAQAEALLAANRPVQALEKAQAALRLGPDQPAALRVAARTLARGTNAAALPLWQQLIRSGKATDAERREAIQCALQLGALPFAGTEAEKLVAASRGEPLNLWLAAQVFAKLGDYARTVEFAGRARASDPGNPDYLLFVSQLLFDAAEPEQRSEARSNLWFMARQTDAPGLVALRYVGARADLALDQTREVIARLGRHPRSGVEEELLALDLSLRLEPARRQELLDQARARYQDSEPATLHQVAAWLNQHEEYRRVLQLVPLQRALTRADLFIPHLDALCWLGRWAEVDKLLENRECPLTAVHGEAYRARCDLQLGNDLSAAVHWKAALRGAEGNERLLTWLGRYAQQCDRPEEAQQAYRALVQCVPESRAAYDALERLTIQTGTTDELARLLAEMQRRWPLDPALRNDRAYFNLLLGRDLAEHGQAAEELARQFPGSLPILSTLALARYRNKDYPAALEIYSGRDYNWELALPGNRAVYAAVLAASGKNSEARQHARGIPSDRLNAEELELIRPLLK